MASVDQRAGSVLVVRNEAIQRQGVEKLIPDDFLKGDKQEDAEENEDDVEEDTGLEEDEEEKEDHLPIPHETSVERRFRMSKSACLKTGVHIEQIREYQDGTCIPQRVMMAHTPNVTHADSA